MTPFTDRHFVTLVMAGGIVMGLALGVRHVQGLFLLPLTMDRGWTRDTFATAMAVQNLTWGLAQPLLGMVADRFGSRWVVVCSAAAYALGLVLMAQAASPMAFMAAAGVCVGIALAGTAFGAIYGAISRLVPAERRSEALGMAGAIGGVGQFVLVPVAQGLISTWGWQVALMALGAGVAATLPLAWRMCDAPVAPAAAGGGGMRAAIAQAVRHRGFWLLNAGFLACGFQLAFITNHLPAYLLDKGLAASDAVVALAIIALTNVASSYGCGWLGARYPRKYLLAWLYLIRTAAMALFVLLPLTAASTYFFAAVMGLLWLGTVPLTNGLLSQLFGVRYITTLFGFVFIGHQVGSFLGSWLGGKVFEATRSYDLIWLIAMGLGVVAAALHWPIDERPVPQTGAAAA